VSRIAVFPAQAAGLKNIGGLGKSTLQRYRQSIKYHILNFEQTKDRTGNVTNREYGVIHVRDY